MRSRFIVALTEHYLDVRSLPPRQDGPVNPGSVGVWTFALDRLPAARAREVARDLERLGYGAIWLPEAIGRDPLVHAAVLLDATERIVVATGIASIHGREPLTMAAGARTLTEAFPERFILGLGVSHAPMVEGMFDRAYESPIATMRAYLDRLDAAPYAAAPPATEPFRVLAALGPRMLALARERSQGAHPYLVTPEHTARAREILGTDRLLAPEQKVVVETDPAAARRIGREALAIYLGLPNYTNNLKRLGFTDDDLAERGSDRLVDSVIAWGDVDAIAARVQAHHDVGANHVAVQVLTPAPYYLPIHEWRLLAPALMSA
jgi:probable F420-dependent oxidoreductase